MARLYGDENFDVQALELLRQLGHDTLTVRDAGQGNQSTPDHEILAFATENNRSVVTFDRRDYYQLHQANAAHGGIVACTYDADSAGLAVRIHESIEAEEGFLGGKFVRVYRPNK
ncbi:MAG: DUF5615 family PIN-like protein [Saprospiraceae bacterium]|nr:DUF5615 family PIN-like protein [Saprospiraceae bacterium]